VALLNAAIVLAPDIGLAKAILLARAKAFKVGNFLSSVFIHVLASLVGINCHAKSVRVDENIECIF